MCLNLSYLDQDGSNPKVATVSGIIADQVIENANEGNDTVNSFVDYILPQNVENLLFDGEYAVKGTGNELNNQITGNSLSNLLVGGAGDDTLDGATGSDTLIGGDGNDVYFIDNANDQVIEDNMPGIDRVHSFLANYTLPGNVEQGRIRLSTNANLSGNTLDNLLVAGTGSNVIVGELGNDTLSWLDGVDGPLGVTASLLTGLASGGSGSDSFNGIENLTGSNNDDHLTGNDGANILDGGGGIDTLVGGDGNDDYFVDNSGDQVVYSALVACTLGANVEIGRIVASGAASLTGNNLANLLYAGSGSATLNGAAGNDNLMGGAGVDVLDGGSGADSMSGGNGNDYYFVDNVGDQVVESNASVAGGNDVVYSALAACTLGANVEIGRIVTGGAASLTGNALANVLFAGSGDNVLDGAAGNDTLAGGLGNDLLIGGSGADTFRFDTAPNGTSNLETIGDFSVVDDTIVLENAVFTSLLASGPLAAGAFRAGAGASSAADADDYLIYDTTTGALYYDAAGNTGDAPVQIALLGSGLALTALDFVVI